ncbi:MAG: hypothetical protein ACKVLD_00695 [Flavobacteriales bacterium]|jgi:hypothetical protein|tara:strand:- start:13465 stop:13626 length:162 start_codon:yes stop_codon:yes gene_type:complete
MGKNFTKQNQKNIISNHNLKAKQGPSLKVLDFIVAYSKVTKSVLRSSNTICLN